MKVNPHKETGLHCMEVKERKMDINAPFDVANEMLQQHEQTLPNHLPRLRLSLRNICR